MDVPFALSIHKFVNSIGADAGFAAFIGVAIVALLYFAQARETATVRQRLEDAQERIGGLETRISQLLHLQSSRPPAAAPVTKAPVTPAPAIRPLGQTGRLPVTPAPAATAAASGASRTAQTTMPAAPIGMAAPALASATKLIPDPKAVAPAVAPENTFLAPGAAASADNGHGEALPSRAATAAGAGTAAAVAAAAAGAAAATGVARGSGIPPDTGASVASTAATAGTDSPAAASGPRPASTEPPTSKPTAGRPPLADAPTGVTQQAPPVKIRTGGDSTASSRRAATAGAPGRAQAPRPARQPNFGLLDADRGGRERRRFGLAGRMLPVLVGLAAVIVIVVGLVVITRGNGATNSNVNHSNGNRAAGTGGSHAKPKPPVFNPATVTVAVLNGTAVNGLAADVSTALSSDGYKKGNVTNGASQTQTGTLIYYVTKYRSAAEHVATSLKLSHATLAPVTSSVLQICATTPAAATTSCKGDVIVSVGQDLASMANGGAG